MKRKFKTLFVVAAAFAVSYQAYGEMKKNESKYFYTARLMNQALLALLEKKDIDIFPYQ